MTLSEQITKDLETSFAGISQKLKQEFGQIRGNRPSVEMVENLRVNLYEQNLSLKELGSLSVIPPRMIQIAVWDPGAVGAVMNAITNAHLGLSATNDGNNIRATLSLLGNERRDELTKLVKKTAETARIHVRSKREEAIKRLKDAETSKSITEDDAFRGKEKIQKATEKANADVEALVKAKLEELGE
ncbi:MAG TPA: ribosome-recycling factor [Candidatus Paceibacterota bacterium]|nr:ribosome-recycling factor [Candidatus Paceibacterota bacterium]